LAMACSADAPTAGAKASWCPSKASEVAAYKLTVPMTRRVFHDGQREAACDAGCGTQLAVRLPTVLVEDVVLVHVHNRRLLRGVDAGATVEVLDGVEGGDLLVARGQRQREPAVLPHGQAQPDTLRHDVPGFATHVEQRDPDVSVPLIDECLQHCLGRGNRFQGQAAPTRQGTGTCTQNHPRHCRCARPTLNAVRSGRRACPAAGDSWA
jgi:hypothetical protein